MRLFVNGVQITAFTSGAFATTYPALNTDSFLNTTSFAANIGRNVNGGTAETLDGYLTDINFIDGQALTPAAFGETDVLTGVWKPKRYTGTYGTNGFYLNFSDPSAATAAAIGRDYSGNSNNWTPNNISVTAGATYDSMLDVPTPWADGGNGRGNYARWSPIDTNSGGTTIWNAGLSNNNAGTDVQLRSTIAVSTGKWYYEYTFESAGAGSAYSHIGLATADSPLLAAYLGSTATSWSIFTQTGNRRNNASNIAYGSGVVANDVVMCAFDVDAGKVWWGKNGTWFASGDPVAGTNAAFTNLVGTIAASCTPRDVSHINFGQRPFAYTPPTGFKALNTQNLPESTIKKGNQYFDVLTYTGDGTNPRTISGLGFQPDLAWLKCRSTAGTSHRLFDSVRGVSRALNSDSAGAEVVNDAGGEISAFTSSGFTLSGSSSNDNENFSGRTYAGWQWKKGATQGFDIVTYTGNGTSQNINHSLGVVPAMIIVKDRVNAVNWAVWHKSLPSGTNVIEGLNTTSAASNQSAWTSGGGTYTPTSTYFSVNGTGNMTNTAGAHVAYLFAEVAGFSKFGSYTGNGSSDGPFVYCGFRPRFILIRRVDTAGNWFMYDTARSQTNSSSLFLLSESSGAEQSSIVQPDVLANGFKLRTTDSGENFSGSTYIYAAFAENPFKYSLAR